MKGALEREAGPVDQEDMELENGGREVSKRIHMHVAMAMALVEERVTRDRVTLEAGLLCGGASVAIFLFDTLLWAAVLGRSTLVGPCAPSDFRTGAGTSLAAAFLEVSAVFF